MLTASGGYILKSERWFYQRAFVLIAPRFKRWVPEVTPRQLLTVVLPNICLGGALISVITAGSLAGSLQYV